MTRHRPVVHLVLLALGFLVSLIAVGAFGHYRAYPGEPLIQRLIMLFLLPVTAATIGELIRNLQRRPLADQDDDSADAAIASIVSWITAFLISVHLLLVPALFDVEGIAPVGRRLVVVLLGITLVAVGNLLPRTRPNMAIGIRTARTLTDRQLWMLTHRATGYATVAVGAVTIIAGAFLHGDRVAGVPAMAMVVAAALMLATYLRRARASHTS